MLRGRGISFCLFVLLVSLASIVSVTGAAFAAETGSLSGVVRSADGAGLPGVTVTVKGPYLPAGRTVITESDGAFSFQRLPPGKYDVSAELSGLGNVSRPALVELDKDTQLELSLKPILQGEITVSAAQPTIDVKSTEAQVNFTAQRIEELPIPRSYGGLFLLAPGVSQNGRLAPNAGGSRLDNTFLVDGINVTNPDFGDIFPDITELDISEVSIVRGGISAEFGRSGGMVVNAITRAGTNNFGGEARYEYQPASFVSANKNSTVKNTTDQDFAGVSLGGPLVSDHFWFYGSASRPSVTTTDRLNNLGSLPDENLITKEYFGKLTANPTEQHFLTFALRRRDRTDENADIISTASPSTGSNDFRNYSLGTFTWTWTLSADSFTEFKYNRDRENNGTNPLDNLGYQPAFNVARPDLMGQFTSTPDFLVGGATAAGQTVGGAALAINNQNFQRDELRATVQSFKEWGSTRHDLRAGGTYESDLEELERRANGWGTVTWNPTTRQFTASYVSNQPPHTGRGKSYGVFGQDQISVGERTTVTAGLLVNQDEYFGEVFTPAGTKRERKILSFDWGEQLQPRLGIAFVPNPQRGDKIYGNFGRYYNTDNKSLGRAASPTRIFTTRAMFDAAGNPLSNVPAANTQTKTIDAGLDPQYTDEYLVGYARPFGAAWTAELWAMYRTVGNIFEDESADGLGNGPFHVAQLPNAYRRYKAVTLTATRRPASDQFLRPWINFSYTWSRLTGNWDIDFGADSPFYNSSFIQDGPGVLITDNRNGILRGDRTHDAKLFATIHPSDPWTVGTFIHFQSGGAWEARGLPDPNVSSSSFVRYLEPAGSRRMPDWTSVDLLTSWDFKIAGLGLQLEGRVTNLFDQQVALAVDDRLILGRPADNQPNNPNFGKGTTFTAPRTFVLSAILRY
ncbi:MAG TPA: TonB-dependent receptor [Thermoanaerobaculia bacterium]|jgi:outer membrane receptor for ferrienterochelin and colicin|nr:TonB-dependent receptor [Thermoanaerobaculia bacterium]